MATKMKVSEIQAKVKDTAVSKFGLVHGGDIIQFGNYDFAVPVELEDGAVGYAKVTVTCGQLSDTKVNPKFDPTVARERWLADLEFKAEQDRLKAELKAKKNK